MLTIILGFVLAVVIVVFAFNFFKSAEPVTYITLLAIVIVIGGFVIGLTGPVSGYHEWELVEETELVTLVNDIASQGGGRLYISISADNVYTYRYEIDSEFGTETSTEYETNTISENVIEIEDPNCEIPVLREYTRKGKMSIWTFALGTKETKYVFYVPEGTVSREVNLD